MLPLRARPALLFLLLSLPAYAATAGTLLVASTTPGINASNVARATSITIDFDRPVQTATVTESTLRVWGWSGGRMPTTRTWSNGNQTLTLTPGRAFFPGERVTVNLASTITAVDGSPLRQGGYTLQFLTRAGLASMAFTLIDTVTVRTSPGTGTRLYGGAFPDLNNDGWIDYVAVNEVSHDLRVLMNRADGSGLVHPVLQPPSPIGAEGSPNEAADYNNDGLLDMANSNTSSSTVSVLLGNGNGTFQPQQSIPVGNSPHGLASLDVDGDADLDIVIASNGSNNLSLMRNNGSGVFGPAAAFESGGNGEYPLAAGDMDNDGLTDLVVGTAFDNQLHVLRSNGNGTFTRTFNGPAEGSPWMISVGDVNGDGNLDVSTANGFTNTARILLGNGAGALGAPIAPGGTLGGSLIATDLGDLDGDGDLDWVLSSYTAARWYVLVNNGSGAFTATQQIPAPQSGSCGSLYDFDNDGDLDLGLADELEDVVLLLRNGPAVLPLFANGFENP